MVWQFALTVGKPFVVLWAALNVIDDLSFFVRLGRLGAAAFPWPGKKNNASAGGDDHLCGLCDDVMGDLLRGTEGLSVVPCRAFCLGVGKCVRMCEALKDVSAETTEFPVRRGGLLRITGGRVI